MVAGILLICLALALFALEAKIPGFGILGIAGILALLAGLALIFGLSTATLPMLIAVAVPLLAFVFLLVYLMQKARKNRVVTGEAGMVGLEGKAETSLLPEGKVKVRGELWDAYSSVRVERGEPVKVVGVRGLKLEVAPASPEHMLRKQIPSVVPDNER